MFMCGAIRDKFLPHGDGEKGKNAQPLAVHEAIERGVKTTCHEGMGATARTTLALTQGAFGLEDESVIESARQCELHTDTGRWGPAGNPLSWQLIGSTRPPGRELVNPGLSTALGQKRTFEPGEFDQFGMGLGRWWRSLSDRANERPAEGREIEDRSLARAIAQNHHLTEAQVRKLPEDIRINDYVMVTKGDSSFAYGPADVRVNDFVCTSNGYYGPADLGPELVISDTRAEAMSIVIHEIGQRVEAWKTDPNRRWDDDLQRTGIHLRMSNLWYPDV